MYSLIVSYNLHESVLPVHILERLAALMKWSFNGQSPSAIIILVLTVTIWLFQTTGQL